MLVKTIEYTDYDGNKRKEQFCFNITKAEFAEMDMSEVGGIEKKMRTLVEKKDVPGMLRVFKDLIMKSYGVKSPDGRRMIKSQELTEEFMQTEAYSELFMELATDAAATTAFIKGIMPIGAEEEKAFDAKMKEFEAENNIVDIPSK